MTKTQIDRVHQEIAHTHKLLNKELSYMPEHQKQDVINSYKNHLVKLNGMIK